MNDVPGSLPVSGSSSARTANRTNRTSSFSDFLERASGGEAHIDSRRNQPAEQTTSRENRVQRTDDRAQSAASVQQDRPGSRPDSGVDSGKNGGAGGQKASQADVRATSRAAANDTATGAAQQADQSQVPDADETKTSEATLTISVTGSADNVKVSLEGLSEELLNAVLAACNDGAGTVHLASNTNAEQQVSSQDDKSLQDDKTDNAQDSERGSRDNTGKATLTVSLDASDMTNAAKEVLAILQGVIEALQDKARNKVTLQLDVAEASDTKPYDSKILEAMSDAVQKGTAGASPHGQSINEANASSVSHTSRPLFGDLLSRLSAQASPTNTDQSGNVAQTVSSETAPDVKPVKEIGASITELMTKIKASITAPDVREEAPNSGERGTDLPSEQGANNLAGQSASVQATIQYQESPIDTAGATSFGSIVADRLATVAEQVSAREKPSDITLRLRMESGESLMVGLKEQAGKIVVQVKSADQGMVGFLESQKETIVRNLEAKQVSSTISVSPIEEDLAKRQAREQQSRNTWGKRREPANPFIETSV